MAGRKPKPTEIKRLEGNPGGRPLNESEPKYPSGAGDAPDALDEIATAEWDRLNRLLSGPGVVTAADRGTLWMYCVAWSRWVRSEAVVRKTGEILKSAENGLYTNPHLHTANRAAETVTKLGSLLGLDPSSRSRLTGDVKTGADKKVRTRPQTHMDRLSATG